MFSILLFKVSFKFSKIHCFTSVTFLTEIINFGHSGSSSIGNLNQPAWLCNFNRYNSNCFGTASLKSLVALVGHDYLKFTESFGRNSVFIVCVPPCYERRIATGAPKSRGNSWRDTTSMVFKSFTKIGEWFNCTFDTMEFRTLRLLRRMKLETKRFNQCESN